MVLGPVRCPECGEEYDARSTSLSDAEESVYRRSHDFAGELSGLNRLTQTKTLSFPCGHSVLTVNG